MPFIKARLWDFLHPKYTDFGDYQYFSTSGMDDHELRERVTKLLKRWEAEQKERRDKAAAEAAAKAGVAEARARGKLAAAGWGFMKPSVL